MPALPRAWGGPAGTGHLREVPEHFVVEEALGFEPDGKGDHVLIQLRKRGVTTSDVAARLARIAGVKPRDVGFCGMKDRHAVTSQWYSVLLPGRPDPDWEALQAADLTVERYARHRRKLRRGSHHANHFVIRIARIDARRADFDDIAARIETQGFPNYFGPQRFGRGNANVAKARAMLSGDLKVRRDQRGMLLSALRSWLFNQVLASRLGDDSWNKPKQNDDIARLVGSNSVFTVENEHEISSRIAARDVILTGPLCGRRKGRLAPLTEQETGILAPFAQDIELLERAGLDADRRSLWTYPRDFGWRWLPDGSLQLSFTLEPGCYATSLVREFIPDDNCR